MKYLAFLFLIVFLTRCSDHRSVTNRSDYLRYLTVAPLTSSCEEEIEFWHRRLASNENDLVSKQKLASLYAAKFKDDLDIDNIAFSDSLYQSMIHLKAVDHADLYRAMAMNAMSQHDFRRALWFIEKAVDVGDNVSLSRWIAIDIANEVGQSGRSERWLDGVKNVRSFQYLIRKARAMDIDGDIDGAITLMEQAHERVSGNDKLASWVVSNLADMYAHAGRLADSYSSYLGALEKDSTQWYALAGIARIAFCHDRDAGKAKEIVEYLMTHHTFPAGNLLMAEIENWNGDGDRARYFTDKFMMETQDPRLSRMFARDRALLLANEYNKPKGCVALASAEIRNRPNAMSYDLLAWGYFQDGDIRKAFEIAEDHIDGQTHEPIAMFHLGMIYQANGLEDRSERCFMEALAGGFELGPAIVDKIERNVH